MITSDSSKLRDLRRPIGTTNFDETHGMLVNIKTGFLREKVIYCKNLFYIKDN